MERVAVVAKWVALALIAYTVVTAALAVGFMGVVSVYRSTRGTVIVPAYMALHLLTRLLLLFGLGFAVGRQSTRGKVWTAAAAGLVLALLLAALETAVGSILTANWLLPKALYLVVLPAGAAGVAALGGWMSARSARMHQTPV